MLIHSVFFWLKPGLAPGEAQRFARGLSSLARIASVRRLHIGTPAATAGRPVVDGTYSYALTVAFDDLAGHDAYQVDPIHDRFVADCAPLWTRVQVYDAEGSEAQERLGE